MQIVSRESSEDYNEPMVNQKRVHLRVREDAVAHLQRLHYTHGQQRSEKRIIIFILPVLKATLERSY